MRILIVDEYPDVAALLSELLTHQGHECKHARSLLIGLGLAEQWAPDVALVDIGPPPGREAEIARTLRLALGARVLLVALSTWEPEILPGGTPFDAHLRKPATHHEIAELIGTTMHRVATSPPSD